MFSKFSLGFSKLSLALAAGELPGRSFSNSCRKCYRHICGSCIPPFELSAPVVQRGPRMICRARPGKPTAQIGQLPSQSRQASQAARHARPARPAQASHAYKPQADRLHHSHPSNEIVVAKMQWTKQTDRCTSRSSINGLYHLSLSI